MKTPKIAKKETIGRPELFSGREQELKALLEWVELIPKELAKSRALMATKKMGKTAILDRLYNILFERGENPKPEQSLVIPFFFRVGERKVSIGEFGEIFYFSFITQYLAFRCKQPKWTNTTLSFPELVEIANEFQLEEIRIDLKRFEWFVQQGKIHQIWEHASSAPHRIASQTGDFILQVIDEFQYLNQYIYVDEHFTTQIDLAGTWHQWAESRIAPLLISGSWVGWLLEILRRQLNPRFDIVKLHPFSDREALECVYNYAEHFDVTISEESALAIKAISGNHPWYISCLIRSKYQNKDLSTVEGVEAVFEYEVNSDEGNIYWHWMEYIDSAFARTNGKHAKAIILFLSAEREQEKTRKEIQDYLKSKDLHLDEEELEDKLNILSRSDIIERGSSDFHYKGIPDDIFNQVIQILYAYEIEQIDPEETRNKIHQKNRKEMSSVDAEIFQQNKGTFLEHMMKKYIKYSATKKGAPSLQDLIQNAPENAEFVPYQTVGERHFNLPEGYHRQFDVVAKAAEKEQPSLLIECKFHENPIGPGDVEQFFQKAKDLQKEIPNQIPILYSISGFTKPAKDKMKELQIAWSTPDHWSILKKQ